MKLNGNGITDKMPPWVLWVMTTIAAPTAVGTAVWNDNQQSEIATMRANLATLVTEVAELRGQMLNKVDRQERLEMLDNLNQRLDRMDRHMEIIDNTLEERWRAAMDILRDLQNPGPP
jgi:predicted transcriptional regulator